MLMLITKPNLGPPEEQPVLFSSKLPFEAQPISLVIVVFLKSLLELCR